MLGAEAGELGHGSMRRGIYVGPDGRRARKLADAWALTPLHWINNPGGMKSVDGAFEGWLSKQSEGMVLSEPEDLWIGLYATDGTLMARGRGLIDLQVTAGMSKLIWVTGHFRSTGRWKVRT